MDVERIMDREALPRLLTAAGVLEAYGQTMADDDRINGSLPLALDVELASPHGRVYLEWTDRHVSGASPELFAAGAAGRPPGADADYWLAGVQAAVDRIHLLLEYDDWTRDGGSTPDGRLDRSVNTVLWVQF